MPQVRTTAGLFFSRLFHRIIVLIRFFSFGAPESERKSLPPVLTQVFVYRPEPGYSVSSILAGPVSGRYQKYQYGFDSEDVGL